MIALRYITAGGAVRLSAAVASLSTVCLVWNSAALAEEVAAHEITERPSSAVPDAATRKVRVIDISAENAVTLTEFVKGTLKLLTSVTTAVGGSACAV
jgi:hypothetical protein